MKNELFYLKKCKEVKDERGLVVSEKINVMRFGVFRVT